MMKATGSALATAGVLAAMSGQAFAAKEVWYDGESVRTDTSGQACELVVKLSDDNELLATNLLGVGRDWNHYYGATERQLLTTIERVDGVEYDQFGFAEKNRSIQGFLNNRSEMVYEPEGQTYPVDVTQKVILKGNFSAGVADLPTSIDKALGTRVVFSEAKGLMMRTWVECENLVLREQAD